MYVGFDTLSCASARSPAVDRLLEGVPEMEVYGAVQ